MLNNVPMYISGSAWGVWEGHIHLLNANTLFIHFKLVKRLLVHADQAAANQTAAANDARARTISIVNIDTQVGASSGLQQMCITSLISVSAVTCIQCVV